MNSHIYVVARRITPITTHQVTICRLASTVHISCHSSISAFFARYTPTRSQRPLQQRRQYSGAAVQQETSPLFTPVKSRKMGKDDQPMAPRPSSSVVLLSSVNEILLLHRVKTSTSFASAHVFPGGNVDPFHDGDVPPEGNPDRHRDGPAYRMCAIRETFEESGILLAKKDGKMVSLPEKEREEARKQIHARKIKFGDWLSSIGAAADTGTFARSCCRDCILQERLC